jgi:hypothetical protein
MLFYTIYIKYILYLCTRFNRLRTAEQKGHKAYSRISVKWNYTLILRNHLTFSCLTRSCKIVRGKEAINIFTKGNPLIRKFVNVTRTCPLSPFCA